MKLKSYAYKRLPKSAIIIFIIIYANIYNTTFTISITVSKLLQEEQYEYDNHNLSVQEHDFITVLKSGDLSKNIDILSDLRSWLHEYRLILYKNRIPYKEGYGHFRVGYGNILRYAGYNYAPPDTKAWCKNQSLCERDDRFPSVNERIKIYMGKWYDFKPEVCLFDSNFKNKTQDKKKYQNFIKSPEIFDRPLVFYPNDLNASTFYEFAGNKKVYHNNVRNYLINYIDLAILHHDRTVPVLLKFGDYPTVISDDLNYSYPVFGKVRDLVAKRSNNNVRYPYKMKDNGRLKSNRPDVFGGIMHDMILWPLNQIRHFQPVSITPLLDVPWEDKKSKLVFRGNNIPNIPKSLPININAAEQRRKAVHRHRRSKFVDAKFSEHCDTRMKICGKASQKQMLEYKYLLSIEGNDLSSGLKWMLFSNSVVFLPPVTYESWALESLLQPFVHYIPVFSNMTNLEKMVKWANTNPERAKQIAERSTLFMYDLLFHPNAFIDDELVKTGIMERYENNLKCKY